MPTDRSPKARQLLACLEDSRKTQVKVYTTNVLRLDKPQCIVSTGSKDVHLELGRMGWEARAALVDLINHETSICNELLLVFQYEGGSRGLICTKHALPDGSIRITLQVAND